MAAGSLHLCSPPGSMNVLAAVAKGSLNHDSTWQNLLLSPATFQLVPFLLNRIWEIVLKLQLEMTSLFLFCFLRQSNLLVLLKSTNSKENIGIYKAMIAGKL